MAKTNEIPESDQGSASEAGNKQKVDVQQAQRVEPSQPSKEIDKDARMWAMFCHLGGLAMFIPVLPVIGNVIAPLIIWQIKKDDYPFVNEQGKEAVNFQISMLIYGLVAGLLCFACIGLILLPAVVVVDVIFLLIAAVKANEGYHYRYPLTIRFIK
jgi:uncharacterized Tic20 family protein